LENQIDKLRYDRNQIERKNHNLGIATRKDKRLRIDRIENTLGWVKERMIVRRVGIRRITPPWTPSVPSKRNPDGRSDIHNRDTGIKYRFNRTGYGRRSGRNRSGAITPTTRHEDEKKKEGQTPR
jgi:hypothetical protein